MDRRSFLQSAAWATVVAGCTAPQPGSPPSGVKSPQSPLPAADPQERVDVLIVGAGLSGLSTAYYLKKAGLSYRLLESTPRVGGRVRTGNYPEHSSAEVGLAEFWDSNPALEIARDLKVPCERAQLGVSSFLRDGKLVALTHQKSNQEFVRTALGPDYEAFKKWDDATGIQIHAIESGKLTPELKALIAISFDEYLKQAKLPERALALVRTILEPEIGTPLTRVSALDGIAEWHLFTGKGEMPNHVKGGNQNLTEAIAQAVGRERISVNAQVTNVIDGAEGVEVRVLDTSTFKNLTYRSRFVVLTVPLYRLFEIQFEPRFESDVYKAIHTQMWGAYFTAHVLFDRSAAKFWTVDGSNALPILTGGPLGVIYPALSDGPDSVMVNLLVTGNYAEAYNTRTMSLDDVQKKLADEFERVFPGSKALIKKWTFYRYHPRAIAAWPPGRSRFDELSEGLRRAHGHIYFGGDFTESSHSDGAVRSAQRVAGQIVAATRSHSR